MAVFFAGAPPPKGDPLALRLPGGCIEYITLPPLKFFDPLPKVSHAETKRVVTPKIKFFQKRVLMKSPFHAGVAQQAERLICNQ